jgi:hypothetical protein
MPFGPDIQTQKDLTVKLGLDRHLMTSGKLLKALAV